MSKQIAFNVKFDFAASGAGFAQSALTESNRLRELGEAMGTNPTLAQWMEAKKAFEAGALATGYKAPEKLWERTVRRAQEAGQLVDKPKATGEAATKKAAQRTAVSEAVAQAVKVGPAALIAKAKAEAEAGKFTEAAKLEKLAQAAVKAAEKAAADAVIDAIRPMVETIKLSIDSMRKANDVAGLELLALCAKALGEGKRGAVAEALAPFKPADVVKLAQVETIAPAKAQRSRKAKAVATVVA